MFDLEFHPNHQSHNHGGHGFIQTEVNAVAAEVIGKTGALQSIHHRAFHRREMKADPGPAGGFQRFSTGIFPLQKEKACSEKQCGSIGKGQTGQMEQIG